MPRTYWWAYWVRVNPETNRMEKFIRGPSESQIEINNAVQMMWTGRYETIELPTKDINKARAIINDKFATLEGNLDIAMRRFRHR